MHPKKSWAEKQRSSGISFAAAAAGSELFLPAVLIFGMAFIANLNVLQAGFVWDDRAIILGNPLIVSWKHLPGLFRQPFLGMYYRPVVIASFMADYQLWGFSPWGYHLSNLLLHCANALIVFFLLFRLTQNRRLAFLTALLFAVHPAHKGVVAIADRTGILSAFFFLLSLLLYLRYCQSKSKRAAITLYFGALISCAIAFFSKEETLGLPLILLVMDRLVPERRKNGLLRLLINCTPFFLLAFMYVGIRTAVLGAGTGFLSAFFIKPLARLITLPVVFLDYLLILLFPLHLDYEPRTPLGSIGEIRTLLGFLFACMGAVFAWKSRRTNATVFGLLWFLIVFLPMSNIVPIYPEAAHTHLFTPIHFLYLPSIGIFLCIAVAFDVFLQKIGSSGVFLFSKGAVAGLLCCILFLLSLLSMKRNFIWQDELRLYRYIVQMHPENPRMRLNLGNVCLERGHVEEALKHLKEAVVLAPDLPMFRNSLALAYKEKLWLDRATEELQQALRLDPDSAGSYMNLAAVYRARKEPLPAVSAALKAVALSPSSAAARVTLGLSYMDANNFREAEDHLLLAIELDPASAEAHNSLGILYAREKRYDLARQHWEKALKLRPLPEAIENLQMLKKMGY